MSYSNPFRRSGVRQYPLIAEALIDIQDLLKGAPLITAATAKTGINEVNDLNWQMIAQGASGAGSSASGLTFNLFELPAGAIIIGGDLKVLTVFNSTTSDTLTLGTDATTATSLLSSTSLQTAARTALTIPNRQLTASERATATWTSGGGTPTTGQIHVMVQYLLPGRFNETQGV